MSWTPERVEKLTVLWREGKTASQISAILGDVTRNAVIGKAHRLGLSGRPSPIKKGASTSSASRPRKSTRKTAERKPKEVKTTAQRKQSKKKSATVTRLPQRPPRDDNAATRAYGEPIGIEDLTERTCRWPIGDPRHDDFHFCGASIEPGQSYCEHHAALAYQQPQPREDRSKREPKQYQTVAPSQMAAAG